MPRPVLGETCTTSLQDLDIFPPHKKKKEIDVFGHPLNRTAVSNRGPPGPAGSPGAGFKLTLLDNYNIEGKRLCNVTEAIDRNDAVNLRLVQRIVLNEIRTMYQVTSSLRSEIDNNNVLIKILEGSINEKLRNLQIVTDHDISLKNSEIIT